MPQTKECTAHTHTHSTMQCGPLSWLPWQDDSSLRSKMTQNSLCLLDLLSSLPSALAWRLTETPFHPSRRPPCFSGDAGYSWGGRVGILRVITSLAFAFDERNFWEEKQRLWVQGGEGKWVCCIPVGLELWGVCPNCLFISWGLSDSGWGLGFWELIKAADNQYSVSPSNGLEGFTVLKWILLIMNDSLWSTVGYCKIQKLEYV